MALRTIKKTNVRNRAALSRSTPPKVTPAVIANIDATAADKILLTFNTRVLASGLPKFLAGATGKDTVTALTQVSATEVELTFSAAVAATDLFVDEGVDGIRTPMGGFVPAGKYAIPLFP